MERICVYPGSFDPITVGHMDIILRAAKLFDRVIVAVLRNPYKSGCFSMDQRVKMIEACCVGIPQVSVQQFEGLTTTFAEEVGACCMIRGLRNGRDFDSEQTLAQINRQLSPEIETIFLTCSPEHSVVSSSAVRELGQFGADMLGYVPKEIEAQVVAHFQQKKQ